MARISHFQTLTSCIYIFVTAGETPVFCFNTLIPECINFSFKRTGIASFEKTILATSCGFIRLIASTISLGISTKAGLHDGPEIVTNPHKPRCLPQDFFCLLFYGFDQALLYDRVPFLRAVRINNGKLCLYSTSPAKISPLGILHTSYVSIASDDSVCPRNLQDVAT